MTIKALLVEDNDGDVRIVKEVVAEAEDCSVALTHTSRLKDAVKRLRTERFDVLLLDLSLPDSQGLHTFDQAHEAAGSLPILVLTGLDDEAMALSALHRGAQDYLVKGQFDGSRLLRTIRYAVARNEAQLLQAQSATATKTDKVYSFMGAKGGCGATTLACHLATALSAQTGKNTLLADFDLVSGAVDFLTRAKSKYTVLDAADPNIENLDPDIWAKLVFKDSGPHLDILTAPAPFSCKQRPKPDRLGRILRFARQHYDWSIVDLGSGLTDFSLALLYDIDHSFIVTTPDVLALSRTTRLLESLSTKGYPRERLHLVVNRMSNRPQLSLSQIEDLLKLSAYAVFPDALGDLEESYTKGTLMPQNSALGEQFSRFASKVASVEEPALKRKRFFLFG
jgi:pilus assembly protein CpaE